MIEKIKKFIHSKVFIVILIILFICSSLIAGTYAWLTWNSTDNTKLIMSIGEFTDVLFYSGNDIGGELTPVYNYTDGLSTEFGILNRATASVEYEVKLNILSIDYELNNESVKWLLVKNGKVANEGDFSNASENTSITLDSGLISLGNTEFKVYLFIDGNMENDPNIMEHTITGNIIVEIPLQTLKQHITNLYVSGNPTLITQDVSNNSYYYSWQDTEQTWGLMNDGLKIDNTLDATTTGLATTVTDTTALTTGTEGNIRYFGPSDSVNNYIYFNCSDYSNQSDSTCEKWRIIGIVDGKVKIIRNESIGNLAWDQDKNQDSSLTTRSNNWETSSLQIFLNGLYYNRSTITSLDYYSDLDGSNVTTLNLEKIGITEATRNNNLISESIWYLGGYSTSSELYPNDIYNYERQNIVGTTIQNDNPFTMNNNIGLMYSSDYGYGTDLTKCSEDLYNYGDVEYQNECGENNWLFNGNIQWPITTNSVSEYSWNVWYIYKTGSVGYLASAADKDTGVRPALYLDSELLIVREGEGTIANPYQIAIS